MKAKIVQAFDMFQVGDIITLHGSVGSHFTYNAKGDTVLLWGECRPCWKKQ